MSERTFTIDAVCAAAGVSWAQLHQWIHRGHFQPIHPAPRGLSRPYTLRDAVHVAAMRQLDAVGLRAGRAAAIVGRSPAETAGQEVLSVRIGDAEIRLDMAAIANRVRSRLVA